ncbi:hypothetical protein FF38_10450 [Lucilia cuprina]|uniref:Uncharacterized protein n=1 Tax=Lucilia cuprina TaxID=7375 RepID=A0A0L0BXF4_LUCCU|nr:hypothetical protein CVS40_6581 [Lucilia cuprina]KNC24690.1 hypothetical protein FF38_10450 [Lucilia cuprina]
MFTKFLCIFCMLAIIKNSQEKVSSRRYNFVINNVTCQPLAKSLKYFECDLEKLATNHYAYTGKFVFNKIMHKNFFVRYFIDISPIGKTNLIHFIDIKMSACNAIETSFEIPMVHSIMLEIRRTSNVPYQCPFKSNFPYTFNNLSFTDQFINKFMPYLHFVQHLDFYDLDKLIGSLTTNGSLLPIRKANKNG